MWSVNWSSLSYASRLLLELSILGVALYVGLMTLIDMLGRRDVPFSDKTFLVGWISLKVSKSRRMVNRWFPLAGMFIVGYVIGQASLFSPIRELHEVEVLSKDADRVYTVMIPAYWNPLSKSDVVTTWRLCIHGDDLPLVKGMVIEQFQYKQEKDCMLIDYSTYVGWKRNAKRDVVDKNGNLLFAKRE